MKRLSFFGNLTLSMFSKPAEDRLIYRLIKKHKCQSFVEVGLGDGSRLERMIQVALTYSGAGDLRYTGIDLFDAREDGAVPLKLIEMHKRVKRIPAKTQLVPGSLGHAIQRIANSHLRTDLTVVSAGYQTGEWDAAIPFLPRMMHANSILLLQRMTGGSFELLSRLDVERLAKKRTDKPARQAA